MNVAEPFAAAGIAILGPFPPRRGGVAVQCGILAECLIATGANVIHINTDLPSWRRHRYGRLLLPFAQIVSILRQLWQTRSSWQILHVHAASWWGFMPAVVGLAARGWRKRLVLTYHGGEVAAFLSRWGWLARPVLRRYHSLLALTPLQSGVFAAQGLPAAVVPNIVPIERFPFRPRAIASPRLLWLRQLEPHYRPADALAVLTRVQARYPAATLTLAGDGSLAAELRAQVERERLPDVIFTGHLQPNAIAPIYAAADIFLNTSAIDNLPLTLLEASACGLPIVSTNAGAIPDLIANGENGLLAPVGDVDALSAHVLRLLSDPDLVQRLSLAARANAEKFSWPEVSPLLAKAYGLPADPAPSRFKAIL